MQYAAWLDGAQDSDMEAIRPRPDLGTPNDPMQALVCEIIAPDCVRFREVADFDSART